MKPLVLAAATLLASGTALAADDVHPYVGIQYHWTDADIDDAGSGVDTTDNGFGIRGGVMKEVHAAQRQVGFYGVELGYVDLGEVKSDLGKAEADGLELAVIGGSEIWYDTYFYGRAGVFDWDADISSALGSVDDSGTDFVLGVGLMYFIDQVQIRGGYDLYRVDYDNESDVDIGVISIGGQFAF